MAKHMFAMSSSSGASKDTTSDGLKLSNWAGRAGQGGEWPAGRQGRGRKGRVAGGRAAAGGRRGVLTAAPAAGSSRTPGTPR